MKGGVELLTRKQMSTGPKKAPPLKSLRVNVLHAAASVTIREDRRPVSMSCRSSGEACVELLEFWNLTVMRTTPLSILTLEIQILSPFTFAHGPGEQLSAPRLLFGLDRRGDFNAVQAAA